jgi:hypothetical protein
MQARDPRADPTVVDLVEMAGLWLAAGDWLALGRTLTRLDAELRQRYPDDVAYAERFRPLARMAERLNNADPSASAEDIRRAYRQATVG